MKKIDDFIEYVWQPELEEEIEEDIDFLYDAMIEWEHDHD